MKNGGANYVEEAVVVVDGVRAIRRRKSRPASKSPEIYLHVPMAFITTLAKAGIPATAWPLALWVIWHYMVVRRPVGITADFAARAGISGRAARRYAVEALAASGLFHVLRKKTRATEVAPNAALQVTARPHSD